MTDCFALLEIERRPAISEESLKRAYVRKSESLVLDKADADALSSLNMAFRVLGNSAERIQHLLTLEFGDAQGGQLGSDVGELFGHVVEALQKFDQEFGSVTAESSPLLRALAIQRMGPTRERLSLVETELARRESSLLSEVDRLDRVWLQNPIECREPLAHIALSLRFVQKWLREVRERKIRLEELA
jgi:hypothetical protein